MTQASPPIRGAAETSRFARSYEAGATVYRQGDRADCCYLLQEGRVQLIKSLAAKDVSLSVLSSPALFGEDALTPSSERLTTARALQPVTLLALPRGELPELLSVDASLALEMMQRFAARLLEADERFENALGGNAETRVIHTLLRSVESAEHSPQGRVVHITPLELASRVGLDAEVVKKAAARLRKSGYVELGEDYILIPSASSLRRMLRLLQEKDEIQGGYP